MKSLIQLTDQQLVHQYLEGNSEALSTIVLRYKSKLYTSLYLLLKDKYMAEDMFQDVFIRVIDKFKNGQYKEEGKFFSWMMRIAHNMCLDHFRKTKRLPAIITSKEVDVFETICFSGQNAENRMIENENSMLVRKMLDKLPEEQREVIIMRHYAELTFKEIAYLKNTSINTVLGQMRYGLINLRKTRLKKQIEF